MVFAVGYFIMSLGVKSMIDFNLSMALRSIFLYPTDMAHMPIAPALWVSPIMLPFALEPVSKPT